MLYALLPNSPLAPPSEQAAMTLPGKRPDAVFSVLLMADGLRHENIPKVCA